MSEREEQMRRDAEVAEGRRFLGDIGASLREHVAGKPDTGEFVGLRPMVDVRAVDDALRLAQTQVATGRQHAFCLMMLRDILAITVQLDEVTDDVATMTALRDIQRKIAGAAEF